MEKNQKYNIICFSNQLWDFKLWTNKKQVMSRLAKDHNVLFVDPPINLGFVLLRQIFRGLWSVKRLITQTKYDQEFNTFIYTPVNILPFSKVTSKWHIYKINQVLKKNKFDSSLKTLLWVYNVQLKELPDYINKIKHNFLIYDCVDNYFGFPENNSIFSTTISHDELKVQEKQLTQQADIVFASAPGLVDRLKKNNKNTHFTPNVGSYELFVKSKSIKNIPQDVKNIKHPIIGFTGALDRNNDYKFDFELFEKLLQKYPDFSFVIIGSIGLKDKNASLHDLKLENYNNVYLLGYKDYNSLPSYFSAFDAYIIPYVLSDYTIGGCFPTKFHDALAAGLPTIVTNLPAYKPFSDVCYVSNNHDEFVKNIKKALNEDSPQKISSRKEVAKQNTWDGKTNTMINLIETTI